MGGDDALPTEPRPDPAKRSVISSSLTSAMAIAGRNFKKISRDRLKNPKPPTKIPNSTRLGMYSPHAAGMNSRDSPVMMIT